MDPKNLKSLILDAKVVGKGAHGVIFRIQHESKPITVKLVALNQYKSEQKFLHIYESLSPACKQYIPKPVNLGVTMIKHRNRFKGVIAYEYVPGDTFRNFIKVENNHVHVSKIIKQIRKALLCIWMSGFIHGDLHLDNIIVMPNHKIKIIDFSTSRVAQPLKFANTASDDKITLWFLKEWKKLYGEGDNFNPNLALFDWKTMYSPGIWKHERRIIRGALCKSCKMSRASLPK